MEKQWASLDDYEFEYLEGKHVVTIRTKDDGQQTLGQIEWANRRILEVVGEIPVYDLRRVHHTGELLNVDLKDGKTITINEGMAEDMWQEYKEAQFDDLEYNDEVQDLCENIMERLSDGIRERMDDSEVDPATIKEWAQKWKAMLEDLEDKINQDDGGCSR